MLWWCRLIVLFVVVRPLVGGRPAGVGVTVERPEAEPRTYDREARAGRASGWKQPRTPLVVVRVER